MKQIIVYEDMKKTENNETRLKRLFTYISLVHGILFGILLILPFALLEYFVGNWFMHQRLINIFKSCNTIIYMTKIIEHQYNNNTYLSNTHKHTHQHAYKNKSIYIRKLWRKKIKKENFISLIHIHTSISLTDHLLFSQFNLNLKNC